MANHYFIGTTAICSEFSQSEAFARLYIKDKKTLIKCFYLYDSTCKGKYDFKQILKRFELWALTLTEEDLINPDVVPDFTTEYFQKSFMFHKRLPGCSGKCHCLVNDLGAVRSEDYLREQAIEEFLSFR